ncbi:lipopolysaccharide biosynthesis protein [Dinghuibacter silviterrae]|nr:oligosaccharide flippase family protein [Dinghuibacter silviterrae]
MPRFFRHISASALQFGLNQALGVLLFFALSRGLSKDVFGELNWSLAVCLTGYTLLGMGLDALVVKRIASGDDPGALLSIYRAHVGWVGVGAYAGVLMLWFLFPGFFKPHLFLPGIALAKTLLFWALPYKQLAAGKERFGILMRMSIVSTVVKTAAILVCWATGNWSVPLLTGIFIAGDAAEWGVSWYLGRGLYTATATQRLSWVALVRESLPQAGVVLFSSALSRFDWIFIGIFVSAARLAEYSFAYKAFEVASLPLLALAPLLVPLFTRWVREMTSDRAEVLHRLLRAELVMAWGTVLWLNLAWVPVVDPLTGGMYGSVNVRTIFLLSLCLPVTYLNNYLWTIHFAHGRLGWILKAFAVGFVLNVVGDVLLIPRFGNEGAAVAFLGAIFVQTLLYHKGIEEVSVPEAWGTQVLCALCVGGAMVGTAWLTGWARLCAASLLYLVGLVLTGRIRPRDFFYLRLRFV